MGGQDAPSRLGGVARRRRHRGAEGLHDVAPERLLLKGALDHEDVEVKAIVCGGLGKRGAPLPRARLGGDGGEALRGGVVGLCERGVELVGAARVVALELVVDVRGRVERALEDVRAAQWARPVDLVHLAHGRGDLDVGGVVVELLVYQRVREDGREVLVRGHGAVWQAHGLGLLRHVRPQVVPGGGNLALAEVGAVGGGAGHDALLSQWVLLAQEKGPRN